MPGGVHQRRQAAVVPDIRRRPRLEQHTQNLRFAHGFVQSALPPNIGDVEIGSGGDEAAHRAGVAAPGGDQQRCKPEFVVYVHRGSGGEQQRGDIGTIPHTVQG